MAEGVSGIDVRVGIEIRGAIGERRELDRIMLIEECFIEQQWARFRGGEGAGS